MTKNGSLIYYLTAGFATFTVATGPYILSRGTTTTSDVDATFRNQAEFVSLENWEPGHARSILFDGRPIVIWRRDVTEMAAAMEQVQPEVSANEWSEALADGTHLNAVGPEKFTRLEWFIASAINVGGYGCIIQFKAGDYGGFLDPCQDVHFDMWGRPQKGPTQAALTLTPAQFADDLQSVVLDVSEMPKAP